MAAQANLSRLVHNIAAHCYVSFRIQTRPGRNITEDWYDEFCLYTVNFANFFAKFAPRPFPASRPPARSLQRLEISLLRHGRGQVSSSHEFALPVAATVLSSCSFSLSFFFLFLSLSFSLSYLARAEIFRLKRRGISNDRRGLGLSGMIFVGVGATFEPFWFIHVSMYTKIYSADDTPERWICAVRVNDDKCEIFFTTSSRD